jgi:DNA-binding beta-propeller fold protein YncE
MPSRPLQRYCRCLSTFLPLLLACAAMANASAQIVDTANTLYRIAGGFKHPGKPDNSGSRAKFFRPMGIVNKNSQLWVVDQSANSLSRIDPDGRVETVVGSTAACGSSDGPRLSARLCQPKGLAIDANGTLYIADTWNSIIRTFDGEEVATAAGIAKLCSLTDNPAKSPLCAPIALAADVNNLYVVDVKSDIYRIDLATGAPTKIAGKHVCGSDDGPGDFASFCVPQGIAINRATGVLYVADTDNHTIREVTPEGKVSTFAGKAGDCGTVNGPRTAARFCAPRGMAIDSAGNLYVADKGKSTIRKITPDGLVSTVAGRPGIAETTLGPLPGTIASPLAITLIGDNRLAVTMEDGDILGINF